VLTDKLTIINEANLVSQPATNMKWNFKLQIVCETLTQPLPNCKNDKFMLAAIKAKWHFFYSAAVCVAAFYSPRTLCSQLLNSPYICRSRACFFRCRNMFTKIPSCLSDAILDTSSCFLAVPAQLLLFHTYGSVPAARRTDIYIGLYQ